MAQYLLKSSDQSVLHQLLSLRKGYIAIAHKVHQRCLRVQGEWWVIVITYRTEKGMLSFKELHGWRQRKKN